MNNIYISTFGNKTIHLKHGIPIEVGADKRSNFLYPLHDNVGENISKENKYYGELTGLYWIWKNKNISSNEMVGFCHFNKCLEISTDKAYKLLVKEKKYDFLVAEKATIPLHPQQDELKAITTILRLNYPKYYQSWNEIYQPDGSSDDCNNAQLFITTGKYFSEYCTFLFGVLSKMRELVGDKHGSPYNIRYCAFMGERLLSVFLNANDLKYKEYHIRYANKIVNLGHKITRLLHINKSSSFYKLMQKKYGAKSSYRR